VTEQGIGGTPPPPTGYQGPAPVGVAVGPPGRKTLIALGGITVFVGAITPAPPPAIPVNSLWINTSNPAAQSLNYWNGSTWVLAALVATSLIAEGTTGQVLVYSGVPALGNLIASISGAAGVDSVGNAYVQGSAVYATISGDTYVLTSGQLPVLGGAAFYMSDRTHPPYIPASLNAVSSSTASQAQLNSGQVSNVAQPCTVLVQDSVTGGHVNGSVVLSAGVAQFGPTSPTSLFWNANEQTLSFPPVVSGAPAAVANNAQLFNNQSSQLAIQRTSGIDGGMMLETSNIVGGNAYYSIGNSALEGQLSDVKTIPAGDASVSSRYEIEIQGFGSWGATTVANFTFKFYVNGTVFCSATIGTVVGVLSNNLSFTCRASLTIIGTGSPLISHGHMTGVFANTTTNRGGNTQATIEAAGSSNASFNNAVSNTIQINGVWSSAGGTGQVIDTITQRFKRYGP
jgi:hypothetical protein